MPPIFTQSSSAFPSSESPEGVPIPLHGTSSTESQEVEDQITNNIQQFTQAPPSSPPVVVPATAAVHVPSSQNHAFMRPSQASTVDYTQTQTPVTTRHRNESPIPELIPESPTKSIPSSSPSSSPVQMLPPALPSTRNQRITETESENEEGDANEESENGKLEQDEVEDEEQLPSSTPQPYSLIRSSQLMSRSQMMREQVSLLDREIVGPPPSGEWQEVGDSDDEDEDEVL